ncbi:MAG TPA: hypothetical protein H9671_10960 [Firmicutes bacterium]|nr:hypothetical protein [Bacillota bacterium]
MGYFISQHINEYGYRYRKEIAEHENKIWYIADKAREYSAAKDIRIFGIRPWLEELEKKQWKRTQHFINKANGFYIWGKIVDWILAFIHNGIADAYLLYLVLHNGLSTSVFFSGWRFCLLGFGDIGGRYYPSKPESIHCQRMS